MSWRQHRFGWAPAFAGAVLAVGLVSCTDGLLLTPAKTFPVRLALGIAPAANVSSFDAGACAKANGARIRLFQSDAVVLDTTVGVSDPCNNAIDLVVPLSVKLGQMQLTVQIQVNGRDQFQGSTTVNLAQGQQTQAEVTVAPVPAGIAAPDSLRTFTKLGDSLRLGGAVVFASGDTLQGAVPTWAVDHPEVVTFSNGFVHSVKEGTAQVTASFQGVTHATRVTVKAVVASLAITNVGDTASMFVGQTRALTAVARDSNQNVLQRTIAWTSSNPNVATVDASGTLRALNPGQTTVSGASEAKTDSFVLTVVLVPVASVVVSPATAQRFVGQTVQLSAATLDAAGNVLTGRTISWSSSNTQVATVNANGLVTAVSPGAARITATSEGVSGSGSITVSVVPVASVVITPSSASMTVGQGLQLSATTYDGAGNVLTGRTVAWNSSDFKIVSTNTTGLIVATGGGVATITATSEGVVGTATISVEQLRANPGSVSDSVLYFGGSPSRATVQISNAGLATLVGLRVAISYPPNGLAFVNSATLSSTTTPSTLTLVLSEQVFCGIYTATATVSSTTAGISPISIPITHRVFGTCIGSSPAPIQSVRPATTAGGTVARPEGGPLY
jgi:uncharacterized protein YjdB